MEGRGREGRGGDKALNTSLRRCKVVKVVVAVAAAVAAYD
jgi:hypothetical protein